MFTFWESNRHWSWILTRMLAEGVYGATDWHQVLTTAATISLGDGESWYQGWLPLAEVAAAAGGAALAAGRHVTAREQLLRAMGYYRWAEYLLPFGDARRLPAFQKATQAFREAAPLLPVPGQQVQVPFGDLLLPGYFFKANDGGPTIISLAGADVYKEELYFLGGRAALERGINVLVFDGPGQGETLRLKGVPTRPDWEVVVTAAVDYLQKRVDVDPNRIGLLGRSFAGYYASRAAAHEHRLRAVVVFGAFYDVGAQWERQPAMHENFAFLVGQKDYVVAGKLYRAFTLAGHLKNVRCPVLILHGEDDAIVPVSDAHRTYDDLPAGLGELKIYPSGTPGAEHCQHDNFPDAIPRICDFFLDKLT